MVKRCRPKGIYTVLYFDAVAKESFRFKLALNKYFKEKNDLTKLLFNTV